MKRKSLLFALLLALGLPWAANAQNTITLTGNLTQTIEAETSYDFYDSGGPSGNYGNSQNYTATFTCVGNITLNFSQLVTESSSSCNNWDYMLVYDGTAATGTLLGRGQTGCSSATLTTGTDYVATSGTMTVEWHSDVSSYAAGWIATITGGAAPSCPAPTLEDVIPETIEAHQASLRWADNGSATNWVLEYSISESFTNATSLTQSGIPVKIIRDLNPGTTYYVRVKSNCGGGDLSNWSNIVSFTTECEVITSFPWSEDFESNAAGNFSNPCWVNEHISGGGTNIFKVFTSTNGTNSTHQLQLPNQSDGTLTKLRLPEMTLPDNDYQFTIDVYRSSNYSNKTGEGIRVYVSTDGEIEGATELAFIPRHYRVANDVIPAETFGDKWYTYSLPIGISGTCYIILRGENQYGASTYMDNFIVEQIPSCPNPTRLNVTNTSITAHEATITWTPGGEETTWIVEFADNADFTAASTETVDDEPTYTFQGLNPVTQYYVRVYAHCGEGNESVNSNVVNFTTDAACKVPTGLTVLDVTVSTAKLSWTEYGESTSWQICLLNNDEENFISANTNPYTLEGLTAETVYTAKVRGICNDEPTDWSSTVSFEPTAKIVIGSGSGTVSYLPSNTNYDFSYTQQIYTVAELGGAGVIESIDFYMTSTPNYDRDLDIYMVSTDKESFANTTDWIAVTNADLVFSGNVNFTAQSWTTITLDEGFIYNGTQNVAIIVDDNSDKWSSRFFLSFTSDDYQSIYKYRDDDDIPITFAESGSRAILKNQIRIMKGEIGDCMKPTQLAATEVGPDFAVLSWVENGDSEAWVLDYNGTTVNVTENPYTLAGLDNETEYTVKVRPACDESLWSSEFSFTTLEGCPAPEIVEVSNITYDAATVAWTGYSDSYNIMLGEPNFLVNASFENNQIPANFTNDANYPWTVVENNYSGAYCAKSASGNNSQTSALELEVTLTTDLTLTFSAKVSSEDGFDKAYFSIDDQVQINGISGDGNWIDYSYPLTAGTHTLLWYYTKDVSLASNDDCFYVDDIQIIDGATGFVNYTSNTNSYNLRDLTPETTYVVQVQGVCGDQTSEWSDSYNFSTLFVMTKDIAGYENSDGDGNWYLIASPLNEEVEPWQVPGIVTDCYDLYRFNQGTEDEWENYITHSFDGFLFEHGKGFLYASRSDTQLTFVGTPYLGNGEVPLQKTDGAEFEGWNLVGNPFAVEAYIDRPFYVMEEGGERLLPEQQSTERAIQPMEGVFVIADEDGDVVTFTTEAPGAKANIVLNLTQGFGNTIDRAIVSIGQGRTLPKFMLNPDDTKLYMPQNGEDYAVVRGSNSGSVPVNFEPAEDGFYSISVDVRNTNLRTLILKDKVRNVSIDLLYTPTYCFKASIGDRADRFIMTFRTDTGIYKEKIVKDANSEDFVFFSNGNWIIDNEGEATLQVIDLNGHVLSSENIYGSTSIQVDAAPGVYMLRLVNGDNVKVQKVVVK